MQKRILENAMVLRFGGEAKRILVTNLLQILLLGLFSVDHASALYIEV